MMGRSKDSILNILLAIYNANMPVAYHHLPLEVELNPNPLCLGASLPFKASPEKAANGSLPPAPEPPPAPIDAPSPLPLTSFTLFSASPTLLSTSLTVASIHCKLFKCALSTDPICASGSSCDCACEPGLVMASEDPEVGGAEDGRVSELTDSIICVSERDSSSRWVLRLVASE